MYLYDYYDTSWLVPEQHRKWIIYANGEVYEDQKDKNGAGQWCNFKSGLKTVLTIEQICQLIFRLVTDCPFSFTLEYGLDNGYDDIDCKFYNCGEQIALFKVNESCIVGYEQKLMNLCMFIKNALGMEIEVPNMNDFNFCKIPQANTKCMIVISHKTNSSNWR